MPKIDSLKHWGCPRGSNYWLASRGPEPQQEWPEYGLGGASQPGGRP